MDAKMIGIGLMALGALAPSTGSPVAVPTEQKPRIQIAILLDTSNSMDGLIDQAKTQLWRMVNEFATAKRNGARPELQVAVYEYGNDTIPAGEGHIRNVLPLTTDLDKVSEELFALRTNGGQEYCGQVIEVAAEGLKWSPANADYKAIIIAGNEPFTQGGVDYQKSCRAAIARGIIVNTIFCGPSDEGVSTKWKDGADLADGRYMNIDQNAVVADVAAPQDKRIAELGVALNQTYVAYGAKGAESKARQEAQDKNAAAAAPASFTQRQVAKASVAYENSSWDLVDAEKKGTVKIEEIDKGQLPEEMRSMTAEQKKAYVEAKAKERERLQSEINRLNEERKKYVADEMKKKAASGANTLDSAVVQTVRDQAVKKGFRFE
ncbi:MAG: VWA domain-containing protein [Acidobacteriota bacterium]